MAAMETKVIQVDNEPSRINEANNFYAGFGWNVQNVQITHNKDTSVTHEQYGDVVFENKETTTINYATITYQRDRGMANYSEIVSLEQEYYSLKDRIEECRKNSYKYLPASWGWWLFFLWPVGVYKIIKNMRTREEREAKMKQFDEERARLEAERDAVYQRAASLVR